MRINQIGRFGRAFAVGALALLAACGDETDVLVPPRAEPPELGVSVSSLGAEVGQRVSVAVTASGTRVPGIQGSLRFDPAFLRYVGQIPDHEAIVVVNEAAGGQARIRLIAVNGRGRSRRAARYAFEVVTPDYTLRRGSDHEASIEFSDKEVRFAPTRDVKLATTLPAADEAVRWTYLDWA